MKRRDLSSATSGATWLPEPPSTWNILGLAGRFDGSGNTDGTEEKAAPSRDAHLSRRPDPRCRRTPLPTALSKRSRSGP